MSQTQAGLLLLLLVPLLWGLMWWGWRGRSRRQAAVAAPAGAPGRLGDAVVGPLEAVYVSSTRAGDWLDRVVVHGLGERSAASVAVHPEGVLVARTGAPDVWVPVDALDDVRRDRGAAGKFVDAEGLVVLTWRLGDDLLDTYLRTRYEADREPLATAVRDLLDARSQTKEDTRG
ncbi:hypothetical protein GCM10028777_24320 [Angustibacter speluncae]